MHILGTDLPFPPVGPSQHLQGLRQYSTHRHEIPHNIESDHGTISQHRRSMSPPTIMGLQHVPHSSEAASLRVLKQPTGGQTHDSERTGSQSLEQRIFIGWKTFISCFQEKE